MNKAMIAVISAAILLIAALTCAGGKSAGKNEFYLRIHIRADSNLQTDQNVKYKVKDEITKLLTPALAECESKQRAMSAVKRLLPEIERTAENALSANGFSYGAAARLCEEEFPARIYGGFSLEDGLYDALIIDLGSGSGDNWWCVVYPPLCFVAYEDNGTTQIKYRSKLLEIIESFKDMLSGN